MTAIASHLSAAELEARYETASTPIAKSHFHAIWLLSLNYGIEEVAAILSFSTRWVRLLVKRYNEHGPIVSGICGPAMERSLRSSRRTRFVL